METKHDINIRIDQLLARLKAYEGTAAHPAAADLPPKEVTEIHRELNRLTRTLAKLPQ